VRINAIRTHLDPVSLGRTNAYAGVDLELNAETLARSAPREKSETETPGGGTPA
jgi:hypothetical protein